MKKLGTVVVLFACTGVIWADAITDTQQKLEGTWKMISGEADGQALPAEARDKARIVFEKNKFAFRAGDVHFPTAYTIDPAKGTIAIDPPKGETKVLRGIYQLNGDRLSLCLTDGDTPPTKFAGGPNIMWIVLERDKK